MAAAGTKWRCSGTRILLGAATVPVMAPASGTPAAADTCFTAHVNMEGSDAGEPSGGDVYGNRAQIWVNGPDVINSLHDSIARTLVIFGPVNPGGNDVEVGWTAD